MITVQDFKNWIGSDAAPGWIFGFTTLLVTIIGSSVAYIRRKRPNVIVCTEMATFTLVLIHRKIRKNIIVKYNNLKIQNLAQLNFSVYNNGISTVKNVKLKVFLDKDTKVLDIVTEKTSDLKESYKFESNTCTFKFPYFNSYRDHKTKDTISILCDGYVDNVKIIGGGEGWSMKYIKLHSTNYYLKRLLVFLFILFLEIAILPLSFSNAFGLGKFQSLFGVISFATCIIIVLWLKHNDVLFKKIFNIFANR